MSLNSKKIFIFVLCFVLLVTFSLIDRKDPSKTSIPSNQNLLAAAVIAPTKNIALTFDDGPYGTSTEKILDILKQKHVQATFFVIGKNVDKFPNIARRIVAEGNLIGNHSYDHSNKLIDMSATAFKNNIQKAEAIIFSQTGLKPKTFRPPYGNISAQMYEKLRQEGYTTVLWNDDAADWDYENSPTKLIEKIIIRDAKPNGIIILHDGRDTKINYPRDNTIGALPYIIDELKSRGFTFVTVDKILSVAPYFGEK